MIAAATAYAETSNSARCERRHDVCVRERVPGHGELGASLGLAPWACSGFIIGVLAGSSAAGSGHLLVLVDRLPDAPPLKN